MKLEELLDKWPGEIPFKGSLISDDGSCMCAQGQVLHLVGGWTKDQLRATNQDKADAETARIMGISRAHAVLLRIINDKGDGAPACVIREPEKVLGDQAQIVLAFWRHLDSMTSEQWDAAWTAAGATSEIQGADVMRAKGQPFYFLPRFGFADPEAVMARDSK